jgi:hypothetical protein
MKRPWALLALGMAALGCHQKQKTAVLTVTPEAVVLIQDGQEICARVARTGIERFRAAEAEERQARDRAAETDRLKLARAILQQAQAQQPPAEGSDPSAAPVPAQPAVPQPVPAGQRFEEYLEGEAAPDLAAADRADELVAKLLPQIHEETPAETGQAVRDLLQAGQEVCRSARTVADSSGRLQDGLNTALRGWEASKAKLAALYTVSEVDARFARHKYGPLLEQARAGAQAPGKDRLASLSPEEVARERKEWDAVQERQERDLAEHRGAVSRWREQGAEAAAGPLPKLGMQPGAAPKPALTPEALQPKMKTWHAAYTGRTLPVRSALSRFLGQRGKIGVDVKPTCKELLTATQGLLADPAALAAPDEAVGKDLKAAYKELEEMAQACSNGQDAETNFRLGSFERAIQKALGTMQAYGLKP